MRLAGGRDGRTYGLRRGEQFQLHPLPQVCRGLPRRSDCLHSQSQRGIASLSGNAPARIERASLKRRRLSTFDVIIAVLWAAVSLTINLCDVNQTRRNGDEGVHDSGAIVGDLRPGLDCTKGPDAGRREGHRVARMVPDPNGFMQLRGPRFPDGSDATSPNVSHPRELLGSYCCHSGTSTSYTKNSQPVGPSEHVSVPRVREPQHCHAGVLALEYLDARGCQPGVHGEPKREEQEPH